MLAWLSVCSEVQVLCIWFRWRHCHPIIYHFIKIFLVPVYPGCPGKRLLNGCLPQGGTRSKSSAAAEMGDRLATIDMGWKLLGPCPFLGDEAGPPSNAMSPGLRPTSYQVASWSIQPFSHNRHRPKTGGLSTSVELADNTTRAPEDRSQKCCTFSIFCPWWAWPLTPKFELGRDYCTMHLTTKFRYAPFNPLEVITLTNKQTDKQTDAAENIHLAPLCYTGG